MHIKKNLKFTNLEQEFYSENGNSISIEKI